MLINRQYVENVGQEESYNVEDLITMKVEKLPHLIQFDVLQVISHILYILII